MEGWRDAKMCICLIHKSTFSFQQGSPQSLFVFCCLFVVLLEAMFLFKRLKLLRTKRKGTVTVHSATLTVFDSSPLLGCLPFLSCQFC